MKGMTGSTRRIIRVITKHRIAVKASIAAARPTAGPLLERLANATAMDFSQAVAALPDAEARYVLRYIDQDTVGRLATWRGLHDRLAQGIETVERIVHHSSQDCPGFVETFRVSD